jgi:hypothetical protein
VAAPFSKEILRVFLMKICGIVDSELSRYLTVDVENKTE